MCEVLRSQISQKATENYWDTSELLFARNNIWIEEIIHNDTFTFTVYYCISPHANMLPLTPVASTKTLKTAVAKARKFLKKLNQDPTTNLPLHCFASFQRWRYSIDENANLDVVKIADDVFFVVGTVIVSLDEKQEQYLLPARSKLV